MTTQLEMCIQKLSRINLIHSYTKTFEPLFCLFLNEKLEQIHLWLENPSGVNLTSQSNNISSSVAQCWAQKMQHFHVPQTLMSRCQLHKICLCHAKVVQYHNHLISTQIKSHLFDDCLFIYGLNSLTNKEKMLLQYHVQILSSLHVSNRKP